MKLDIEEIESIDLEHLLKHLYDGDQLYTKKLLRCVLKCDCRACKHVRWQYMSRKVWEDRNKT